MRILFLLLASSAFAVASETFAWKVPVSNFSWNGLEAFGVIPLAKPPEASPFFTEGDSLWNVAEAVTDRFGMAEDSFDWAVWNATTGRLVAKGSMVSIHTLHSHLKIEGFPLRCRHTIEVFQIKDGTVAPDFSRTPDASLSLSARSGQKSTSSVSKDGTTISFEGDTTVSEDNSHIELFLLVSATFPDFPQVDIQTTAVIPNGAGVWIAREFNGKRGVDVRIRSELELSDGTPFAQAALRQEGKIVKPFILDRTPRKPVAMDDGAWLVFAWADFDTIVGLFEIQEDGDEIDPFAEEEPSVGKRAHNSLPQARVPEILAPYFSGSVISLNEILKKNGLNLKDGDFAGFDPTVGQVFLHSSDKMELDKFESLFEIYHHRRVSHSAITFRGNGRMRLVARSGRIAKLKSTDPASKHSRLLEIEPTIGENNDLVDLRLLFEEKSGEEMIRSLNTSTTLLTGKFVELLKDTRSDKTGTSMEFKAEVNESN